MPDESVRGGSDSVPILGDLVGVNFAQRVKLDVGGDGASVPVVGALPVSDAGGSFTIDSPQLPAALGGTTSAASLPVVLSSDGPFATQTGSVTETAPTTDIASSGLNGRLQRIAQRLTSLIALLPAALGAGGGLKVDGSGTALPVSGTVAVSGTVPVSGTVTANAGTGTQAVSAASLPLPAGASTETTLAAQSAKLPATLGQKAMAASMAVTVASDQSAVPVSGTVTANAGTNLNTSALALDATLAAQSAKLPATLGQKAMAASLPVVLASDQSALPVSGTVTATFSGSLPAGTNNVGKVDVNVLPALPAGTNAIGGVTQVGSGTNASGQVTISSSSATVIAARAGRRGVLLINYQTVPVYLDASGGTATTAKMRLDPGAAVMLPVASAVTGITSAAYSASPADAQIHYTELY